MCVHGPQSLQGYRECMLQLAVADRVVLTKTDLVSPEAAREVEELVRRANPQADVVVAPPPGSAAAPDVLNGLATHAPEAAAALASEAAAPAGRFGHLLRYGVTSHVVRVAGPVRWPEYADWVRALQRTLGERLLRAKGILAFEDGQHYAIHGVRHLFAPPQPMAGAVPPTQRGCVVLITSNADADEIAGTTKALGAGCAPVSPLVPPDRPT